MAIGSARMLGFDIPRNFNLPYMARSITEFWRRWHISLSSWLRDYLYIPLGGSRKGRVRQHLNQLLTFALGGLWHGANWRFVVWGVLHGLALMAHQEYRRLAQRFPALDAPLLSPLYWAVTFSFVAWGCVLFRAPDLETAAFIYMKTAGVIAPAGIVWHASALLWALPVVAAFHVLGERFGEYHPVRVLSFRGAFALSLALLAALFLAPTADSPFIYFQF
jgi:alginate O-acetyltransferase complex protein AlgI